MSVPNFSWVDRDNIDKCFVYGHNTQHQVITAGLNQRHLGYVPNAYDHWAMSSLLIFIRVYLLNTSNNLRPFCKKKIDFVKLKKNDRNMAYSEEDNSTLRLLSASFAIQVRSMTHGSFFTHVVMNETVLIGFLKPSFSLLLGSLDVNKEFILHLYCSFLGTTNFMRGPPPPPPKKKI